MKVGIDLESPATPCSSIMLFPFRFAPVSAVVLTEMTEMYCCSVQQCGGLYISFPFFLSLYVWCMYCVCVCGVCVCVCVCLCKCFPCLCGCIVVVKLECSVCVCMHTDTLILSAL